MKIRNCTNVFLLLALALGLTSASLWAAEDGKGTNVMRNVRVTDGGTMTLGGTAITNWTTMPVGTGAVSLVNYVGWSNAVQGATNVLNSATNALQVQAAALQGATGILNSATNALQGQVTALQGATNILNLATNALQGQVTTLQGATNILNSATNALQVQAKALQDATNALQGQATALQGATNILNAATNALQGQVTTLQGATNVLNSATNALQIQAAALQGATNVLNSATNALQTQATALQGATGSLDTAVGNLNARTNYWNNGVIIYKGSGTLVASNLYYLGGGSVWSNANAVTNITAQGLLGMALGTTAADGLLLNGQFPSNQSYAIGATLYMQTNDNRITDVRPFRTNNVVRIVGYVVDANTIMFNPDRTYIEILGE